MLRLKPKVKQIGFSQKELKGIAARIADNLESADDASDEEVNAEIDTKIEAVVPYLSFGQSFANRVIGEYRRKNGEEEEEPGEDVDGKASASRNSDPGSKSPQDKGKGGAEDIPEWARGLSKMVESLTGEVSALKSEKEANGRRAKLESLLKDAGTFGTRTLKSFDKMKFDNEEDFEEFIAEVKDDLNAFNKERADLGLSAMGTPPVIEGKQVTKEEPFSDEEIDAMAQY